MTDNRNRTVSDVRHVFARHGGNLGAEGSVAYLFNQVGVLEFPAGADQEKLLAAALEAGAEDVLAREDGVVEILTDPRDFVRVRDELAGAGLLAESGQVTQRAFVQAELEAGDALRMLALLEALEDMDDVQDVYSNAAIPAGILAGHHPGATPGA